MAMNEFKVSVTVDAPQIEVWNALVDWKSQGEWMALTYVTSSVDSGGDSGIGTEIRAFTGIGKFGVWDEMRVGIGTATLVAYVTINGTKTYSVNNYGYVARSGTGQIPGNSGNVGYSLYTSGRIQCTELDATSDERLKDISGGITAEDAIRFVQSVSGMYYSWKSDPSGALRTGFIAQDVHEAGFDHMISAIPRADLS